MKKSIQYIDDSFLSPKDAWDSLSLKEKSDMIRSGVENGITKLQDIRKAYNEFAEGGDKKDSYYTINSYSPRNTNSSIESVVELRPEEVARLKAQENFRKWAKPIPYKLPDTYGYGNIVGVSDITDRVSRGGKELYDSSFPSSDSKLFKDKDDKIYKVDNTANVSTQGLTEVSRQDLDTMLPKRDYIGGEDYRIKVAQKIPGFTKKVAERAQAYGISPNVLMHRLLKEGFIDYATQQYNDADVATQKDPAFWNGLWNSKLGGYDLFGLDYVGDELMQGKYSLLDSNAEWYDEGEWQDTEGPEGYRTGKHKVIPVNLSSAIEMMAAGLGWRKEEMQRKYNPSQEDMDAYVNGAYNAGPYSPLLENIDSVRNKYPVPDYFGIHGLEKKYGGLLVSNLHQLG